MVVFVNCNNEYDPIKYRFFRRLMADNSVVSNEIWKKFKLIQGSIIVLVYCKYEDDPIKNKGARVLTTFIRL